MRKLVFPVTDHWHRTFCVVCSLALGWLSLPASSVAVQQATETAPPQVIEVPTVDIGANLLKARAAAQQRSVSRFKVFYDFRFTDRLKGSGIGFLHQAVEDAGKHYKMVHYDHGNGIAVADVDGDGLHDIYFLTQVGRNELWRNLGNGRFEDVTDKAGVAVSDRISVTASFADVDNDGDPDLFVSTVKMGNILFENQGKGRFKDITRKAGLEYVGHSSGAVFFDYDKDGLLDLFLTNIGTYTTDEIGPDGYYIGFEQAFDGHLVPERTEQSVLYRNAGGNRFENVSEETHLVDGSWSGDASFVDFNQDTYPDLYVLNMQGDDHYYENQGGRSFDDKTLEHFDKTPWGTMGVKFFDYNNDGKMDLFLTDMHSDMGKEVGPDAEKLKSDTGWNEEYLQGGGNNIFGNAFFENQGGGRFQEVSDLVGVENYWPWGLSVGDLNADGFEDAFVASSMSFPWRYGVNTVLLNNRGELFLDSEFILGVEPRKGEITKTPWFDIDCSGPDGEHKVCQGRAGSVTVMGNLGTRSSVIFDLDEDGDMDIVTSEFHARPQVLVSDLSARREIKYLEVKLVGTQSNRDGLGARVRVVAGKQVFTRYHDGKSGYLSQSSLPLYFGLTEASSVDRVEVLWPSGIKQTVTEGIGLNSLLEIVEESSSPDQVTP